MGDLEQPVDIDVPAAKAVVQAFVVTDHRDAGDGVVAFRCPGCRRAASGKVGQKFQHNCNAWITIEARTENGTTDGR